MGRGVDDYLYEKSYFVDENWIISIVTWSPIEERAYYAENRFTITTRKKVGKRFKTVVVRVEETNEDLIVLLVHVED